MKTSEIRDCMKDFCEVLNTTNKQRTFEFEEDKSAMRIVKHIGKFRGDVCSVLKDAQDVYGVNVSGDIKCSNIYLIEFIENVRNYAETPLGEREDEKRWCIHFVKKHFEYLNRNKDTGSWELLGNAELGYYQTGFTRQEIADFLKTDDETFVDNFINRFGEEVVE